jgi:hypothetical protein
VKTELVYVELPDPPLTQASEATGLTVEEIVQAAVSGFLEQKKEVR